MKLLLSNKNLIYIIFTAVVLSALLLRIQDLSFFSGANLWAEDGNIFINQAYTLGIESLYTTYAGYIHLYPRIFALLVIKIGIAYAPLIFLIGWLISFLVLVFVIVNAYNKKQIPWVYSFIVIFAIIFQPHSGETFFNITNAQWFLAIAMTTWLLSNDKVTINIFSFFLLVVLGLTGPYSIILVPMLLSKMYIEKDFRKNLFPYTLIMLTAFIQIYFIINSNRISGEIDNNILNWIKSFYIFFTFDGKSFVQVLALAFWSIYGIALFKEIRDKNFSMQRSSSLLLLIAMILFYLSGLWASKANPLALSPMGGGARYFVIPYALAIIAIPLIIQKKIYKNLLFILFFTIASIQFTKLNRSSLNFNSFIWMSNKVKNVIIPINPQWSIFPGWHINTYNDYETTPIKIKTNQIKTLNGTLNTNNLVSTNHDIQLSFTTPSECQESKHIGVTIDITRNKESWAQLFWSNDTSFNEKDSLKRFYPSGSTTMQFTFSQEKNNKLIRFDPSEKVDTMTISSINIYCDKRK